MLLVVIAENKLEFVDIIFMCLENKCNSSVTTYDVLGSLVICSNKNNICDTVEIM